MECKIILEIWMGKERMVALGKSITDMPFLPYMGSTVVLEPVHPTLRQISATVLYGAHPDRSPSIGLCTKQTSKTWPLVAAHFRDHGWKDVVIKKFEE